MLGTRPSSVGCHAPSSTEISTASMPVCCDQAEPPTRPPDATTSPSLLGTSMRDDIFTGPFSDQPFPVQKASMSANRVTSISTTHLQAET